MPKTFLRSLDLPECCIMYDTHSLKQLLNQSDITHIGGLDRNSITILKGYHANQTSIAQFVPRTQVITIFNTASSPARTSETRTCLP